MPRYRENVLYVEVIKGQIERCAASFGLSDFNDKVRMLYALVKPYVEQDPSFVVARKEFDEETESYWMNLFSSIIVSLDKSKLLLKREEIYGDEQL